MSNCTGDCIFGKCSNRVCLRQNAEGSAAAFSHVEAAVLCRIPKDMAFQRESGLGIAVDLGTTTVVLYLFDLEKGYELAMVSALNPQLSCGVDVISRISFCEKEDGLEILQKKIADTINNLIEKACLFANKDRNDIKKSVIAGNTVMLHLLAGLSPSGMGKYPFTPAALFGGKISAKEMGLFLTDIPVYLLPCLSAFIGGDITADLIAAKMAESEKMQLLLDLGTNGEIVLGNRERLFTASTAAGPAFEGGGIEKGMAGVNGAVCAVYPQNGAVKYDVIGHAAPKGLCGSGVLDMISLFLALGIITESGEIRGSERFVKENEKGHKRIELCDDVYLTQKDIREFQSAKAAVAAGVETLLKKAGIDRTKIDKVFIAGGFGNGMRLESAVAVGLIDPLLKEKVQIIGNGAGCGAAMLLLDESLQEKAEKLRSLCEHVELGDDPYFSKRFIENMWFPSSGV